MLWGAMLHRSSQVPTVWRAGVELVGVWNEQVFGNGPQPHHGWRKRHQR